MSEASLEGAIPAGRPSAGAVLADALAQSAQRRERRRDLRPLTALLPYVRAHRSDAVWAAFFLLVSTGATLGISAAARLVVDRGLGTHTYAALNRTALIAACVVGALAAATALRFYFVSKLGERVVADLRKTIYDHVLTLDQAFFLTTRTGEVLSRLTTDMTIVESMVGSSASVALRNSLSLIGSIGLLAWVAPQYTIYVVLLAPLILGPLFFFGRRVRTLSTTAQDRFADAVGYAGESLDALETVQAFGREASVSARFGAAVETAFRASMARVRARA